MQTENLLVRRAEEIAPEVWRKMGRTDPADPEKLGFVPQIRIKRLDDGVNGPARPDRIELNVVKLEDSDEEAFLQEVIRHELAHVAEYRCWSFCSAGHNSGEVPASFKNQTVRIAAAAIAFGREKKNFPHVADLKKQGHTATL